MSASHRFYRSTPKGQRGIATVLIVVLVGLGLTATSMGIMHSVRSTQQKQIASHALTHSQAGAWTGVEVFRRYLASLTTAQLTELALNQSIDFTLPGTTNVVNAIIKERVAPSGTISTYQVKTRLTYSDIAAKSSAALEVIYEFSPPANNSGIALTGEFNFHRSTSLGGDIKVTDGASNNTGTFNVDGNLDLTSIGLTGVVNLNATGDIILTSAVPALAVKANGTVKLTGAASANLIEALGAVTLSDGATAKTIRSNSLVKLNAGGTTSVSTRGGVDAAGSGTHASITALGNYTHAQSANVTLAHIGGSSSIDAANWPTLGTLNSIGNVTCNNVYWNNFTRINTKGSATGCATGSSLKVNQSSLTPPTVVALTPFGMSKPRIDVWTLKNTANYVFEYVTGKIRVTVKDVASVPDGIYYLGLHTYNSVVLPDALCKDVTAAGLCVESSASTRTICQGQSAANSCYSYDSTKSTFTINSKNVAPGAMWFKGSLLLNNGNYFNTFMATGGIEIAGATTVTSLNYGGYAKTCNANYQGSVTLFTGLYPKNFCNTTTTTYIANPAGNPALIAGGYNPAQGGSIYSGGDIKLAASGQIYGSVLAGDTLTTGGQTVVRGFITAAALSTDADPNTLGGSTTVDLSGLPSTYTPSLMPDMSTAAPADPEVARVLWSRFL